MIARQQWIERICQIEREYMTARSAIELLEKQLHADPSWGREHGWHHRDAVSFRDNLERTYIVRLYAEFESGLRGVWERYFKRRTHPRMKDLIAAISSLQSIPDEWSAQADEVRAVRNAIVHERTEQLAEELTIAKAKSCLCRYLGRAPEDW